MVILLTGAASNPSIGRATALLMAGQGHKLGLLDVDEVGLADTAELCRRAGGEAIDLKADVSSTASVEAAVAELRAHWGPVDCVVANAGIARVKSFADLTDADWDDVLSTNLGGTWRCARAVIPDMIERRQGRIVAVSSVMGSPWGWARHVHYSASKAAIEGLVRALAVEVGPYGITVNAVSPGFIRTNQSLDPVNSGGEEGLRKSTGFVPLGRIGEPEDVAGVVAFLCSDAARYVTGRTILIDGGLTLGDLSATATRLPPDQATSGW